MGLLSLCGIWRACNLVKHTVQHEKNAKIWDIRWYGLTNFKYVILDIITLPFFIIVLFSFNLFGRYEPLKRSIFASNRKECTFVCCNTNTKEKEQNNQEEIIVQDMATDDRDGKHKKDVKVDDKKQNVKAVINYSERFAHGIIVLQALYCVVDLLHVPLILFLVITYPLRYSTWRKQVKKVKYGFWTLSYYILTWKSFFIALAELVAFTIVFMFTIINPYRIYWLVKKEYKLRDKNIWSFWKVAIKHTLAAFFDWLAIAACIISFLTFFRFTILQKELVAYWRYENDRARMESIAVAEDPKEEHENDEEEAAGSVKTNLTPNNTANNNRNKNGDSDNKKDTGSGRKLEELYPESFNNFFFFHVCSFCNLFWIIIQSPIIVLSFISILNPFRFYYLVKDIISIDNKAIKEKLGYACWDPCWNKFGYAFNAALLSLLDPIALIMYVITWIFRWRGSKLHQKLQNPLWMKHENRYNITPHLAIVGHFVTFLIDIPFVIISLCTLWRLPITIKHLQEDTVEHDKESQIHRRNTIGRKRLFILQQVLLAPIDPIALIMAGFTYMFYWRRRSMINRLRKSLKDKENERFWRSADAHVIVLDCFLSSILDFPFVCMGVLGLWRGVLFTFKYIHSKDTSIWERRRYAFTQMLTVLLDLMLLPFLLILLFSWRHFDVRFNIARVTYIMPNDIKPLQKLIIQSSTAIHASIFNTFMSLLVDLPFLLLFIATPFRSILNTFWKMIDYEKRKHTEQKIIIQKISNTKVSEMELTAIKKSSKDVIAVGLKDNQVVARLAEYTSRPLAEKAYLQSGKDELAAKTVIMNNIKGRNYSFVNDAGCRFYIFKQFIFGLFDPIVFIGYLLCLLAPWRRRELTSRVRHYNDIFEVEFIKLILTIFTKLILDVPFFILFCISFWRIPIMWAKLSDELHRQELMIGDMAQYDKRKHEKERVDASLRRIVIEKKTSEWVDRWNGEWKHDWSFRFYILKQFFLFLLDPAIAIMLIFLYIFHWRWWSVKRRILFIDKNVLFEREKRPEEEQEQNHGQYQGYWSYCLARSNTFALFGRVLIEFMYLLLDLPFFTLLICTLWRMQFFFSRYVKAIRDGGERSKSVMGKATKSGIPNEIIVLEFKARAFIVKQFVLVLLDPFILMTTIILLISPRSLQIRLKWHRHKNKSAFVFTLDVLSVFTSMVFDLPFYLCWLLVFFTPMRRYRYVHYEFDELKTQWQDDKKWIFDKGKKQWRKEKKQAGEYVFVWRFKENWLFRLTMLEQAFYYILDPLIAVLSLFIVISFWRFGGFKEDVHEIWEHRKRKHFEYQFLVFSWAITCILDVPFVVPAILSLHRIPTWKRKIAKLGRVKQKDGPGYLPQFQQRKYRRFFETLYLAF